MSIRVTLLGLPQEVFVVILLIHFSDTYIKVCAIMSHSRRTRSMHMTSIPTWTNILFVNKILHEIASACFFDSVGVIFTNGALNISSILHNMHRNIPWNQITYMIGSHALADSLEVAFTQGWCPPRLRRVRIYQK